MFIYHLFFAHPHRQGVSYFAHLLFAMGIAIQLSHRMIAFTLHAIFPFIDIPRSLDLEATTRYLQEQNNWIEDQKPESNLNFQKIK